MVGSDPIDAPPCRSVRTLGCFAKDAYSKMACRPYRFPFLTRRIRAGLIALMQSIVSEIDRFQIAIGLEILEDGRSLSIESWAALRIECSLSSHPLRSFATPSGRPR